MIDDTLKEIRFVFNVGLLHSPYVIIYIKKEQLQVSNLQTHIYTLREREKIREMEKIYM